MIEKRRKKVINSWAVALVLGSLLLFEAVAMIPSIIVSVVTRGDDLFALSVSCLLTAVTGGLSVCLKCRSEEDENKLGRRDGYIIVSLVWIVFSVFGSLPYYIGGYMSSYTDAFFETISGFTTTGATILTDVESIPQGLMLWRCMSQWLGGMGIILLSIAILPFLGIGGMQLYIAEVPGPTKDKLSPRVTQTARLLWGTYLIITIAEVIVFSLCGMNVFDSVCHAFTTISTGGFSNHNEGIAYWNSASLEWSISFFMLISAVNFGLTYKTMRGRFDGLRNSEELRFFLLEIFVVSVVITVGLLITNYSADSEWSIGKTIRLSFFESLCHITGCGYVMTDVGLWHPFLWCMLMFCMVVGGCAGSASGGLKVVRVLLLIKNSNQEFKRMLHPNAFIPVRFNGKSVDDLIINNVLAFVVLYCFIFVLGSLVMALFGNGFTESIGMTISCLSNCGPGFGAYTNGCYASQPMMSKWVMSVLMLIGRLEFFTILFVLTPVFWKKY